MILYYAFGGCSLASHITLNELDLACTLVSVDRSKRTSDGRDFLGVSPKGATPTLELDDGTVLTESLAILARLAQGSRLLPAEGMRHWRVLEATSFMTTEVHGSFKTFFYPDASQVEKDRARAKLDKHFATLAAQLGDQPFLLGDLTMADPYLFTMLTWAGHFGIELPPSLAAYRARLAQHPSVARALAEEGLS